MAKKYSIAKKSKNRFLFQDLLTFNMDLKYVKRNVSQNEIDFYKLLKDTEITPPFDIGCDRCDGRYLITTKYPMTLEDYMEANSIKSLADMEISMIEKIRRVISKLHNLNIFHGDLHGGNIVIDPKTGDIRIIDFESSRKIDEKTDWNSLAQSYFKQYHELLAELEFADPKKKFFPRDFQFPDEKNKNSLFYLESKRWEFSIWEYQEIRE